MSRGLQLAAVKFWDGGGGCIYTVQILGGEYQVCCKTGMDFKSRNLNLISQFDSHRQENDICKNDIPNFLGGE